MAGDVKGSSRIRHGLALAMLAALVLPASAPAASGNLDAFISKATPAQNASIGFADTPTFQIISSCKGMGLQAYVSRSSTVDGDGAFLGGDVQDTFPMPETSFGSGIYEGKPLGTWLQQAGPYFWQLRTIAQCTSDGTVPWASLPVAIQVLAQSSGGTTDVVQQDNGELLTIDQARVAISPAVLKAKRTLPRGLKRTCTRRSSGSILAVVCSASWNDRKKYTYNGLFRMALNDDGTIEATFNGRRALLSCVKKNRAKRQSVKRCFKKHAFTATVQ